MTKCAGCRVRHRICDVHSPCKECEKHGRECVRLNVRFRNLVCPSEKTSRADYSKYEFFFDGEQTWVDTGGNLEFVAGGDSSDDASPMGDLEEEVFNAVEVTAESRPALMEKPSATIVLGSTYRSANVQASILDDDPPDYQIALEQTSHDPPKNVRTEDTSAKSSRETSQPAEKLASDRGAFCLGSSPSAPQVPSPLNSLQEAKLFQHFITHLAPWVRKNFHVPSDEADSLSRRTLAIAIDTLARSRPAWQRQALC